LWGMKITAL
jgi:hypothetical protein